jgi:hypothetical protein
VNRRRAFAFEQPSLVPMADMLTNTVGIMILLLIFTSLSAGGAVIFKRLPLERSTKADAVWMLCSHGRMVELQPGVMASRLRVGLGDPTYNTAVEWAREYSTRPFATSELLVSGNASAEYDESTDPPTVQLVEKIAFRARPGRGDDEVHLKSRGSTFQRLLAKTDRKLFFFYFYVDPSSISVFRAARDRAASAGFNVGWAPLGADIPVQICMAGCGVPAKVL